MICIRKTKCTSEKGLLNQPGNRKCSPETWHFEKRNLFSAANFVDLFDAIFIIKIYIPAVAESHDWNNGKLDLPLCGLLSLEQFLEEKRLLVKSSFQRDVFCSRKRTPWNNTKRFFSPCASFRLISNNKWWTHLVTFTGLSNLSKAISWLMPIGLWYKGCMIILLTVKSCSTPVVSLLLCEPSLRKNKKHISELERKQRFALWICG